MDAVKAEFATLPRSDVRWTNEYEIWVLVEDNGQERYGSAQTACDALKSKVPNSVWDELSRKYTFGDYFNVIIKNIDAPESEQLGKRICPKEPLGGPAPTDGAPQEPGITTIKSEYIGCKTREIYDRLINVANSGDTDAFDKLFTASALAGDCRIFKAGEEIFREELGVFSGRSCVRPRGEVNCYHIPSEAVLTPR